MKKFDLEELKVLSFITGGRTGAKEANRTPGTLLCTQDIQCIYTAGIYTHCGCQETEALGCTGPTP